MLPRNFDSSRKAKNFYITGQFFEDFQSSSINFATTSLRISVVEFFTFHSPYIYLAIVRKIGSPKIFVFENSDGKRYQKILCVVNLKMSSKIFGETIGKP